MALWSGFYPAISDLCAKGERGMEKGKLCVCIFALQDLSVG